MNTNLKRVLVCLMALAAALLLALTARQDGPVVASQSRKPRAQAISDHTSVEVQSSGNRYISVREGRDLAAYYVGSSGEEVALEPNEARPLSLCSGDFDEDGTADLVSAYSASSGGLITLHRGNEDSISPNSQQAQRRRQEGTFTDAPFLLPARVFETAEAADFLGAGDFNADGHLDLVTASRGGSSLQFFSGDGGGSLARSGKIDLPGAVTALACGQINRLDGLADIIVALASSSGAKAFIFESTKGASRAEPLTIDLPARATSIVTSEIEGDPAIDVALACGNEILVVKGRNELADESQSDQPVVIRRTFSFSIRSFAVGDFFDDSRPDIALLSNDGAVHLLSAPKNKKQNSESVAKWQLKKLGGESFPQAASIQCARLTSHPGESLVVVDSASGKIHIIDSFKMSKSKLRLDSSTMVDLAVETEPVAALGVRLTPDALDDLVILRKGQVAPAIAPTAPLLTFTVMNTNDAGANSLREAIDLANANAGLDTINFQIGTGAVSIVPMSALPTITDAVLIDGTTQPGFTGTPLIGLSGTNMGTVAAGLLITGGNSTVRALSITNVQGVAPNGAGISLSANGGNGIQNCFIGLDQTGNMAFPNGGFGVAIAGGTGNAVGGLTAGFGNVISGNTGGGVSISGNGGNLVQGNRIGTDSSGTVGRDNGGNGVAIGNSPNNVIGGTTNAARNVISSNTGSGVAIIQSVAPGASATGNLVQRNFIGTDATGQAALSNGQNGVTINGASGNTIGGPSGGNVLSGNTGAGVFISGGASGNSVRENNIGVDIFSSVSVPNSTGVEIDSSPGNTVGGTVSGGKNLISGNNGNGVSIRGSASTGNIVRGNFIGTDSDAIGTIPNTENGVAIFSGALNNTIGGTGVDTGNVISGNGGSGVFISDSFSNIVLGNMIGTDSSGTMAASNGGNGISIRGGANTLIGGVSTGAGNIIAFNNGLHGGVSILDADIQGTGTHVVGNSIFSNAVLGINIGDDGVTPNDPGDGDAGPNNVQNFPVLSTAASGGGFTVVQGTLNSTANTTFTLGFYSSSTCDGSGFGEGEVFLGTTMVTTDGSGNAAIAATLPVSVGAGQVVTATATDPGGSTSEFSNCAVVAVLTCIINCPADQNAFTGPNEAACGTRVTYPDPQIIGTCGTVNCTPPTGSFFPVGSTQVTCTTGFGPSCSFNVIVQDRTRPKITCPDNVTASAGAGQSSAVVNYPAPTVTDNCPGATVSCSPPSGSIFPLGTSTVDCIARDDAINEAACFFTVTVNDSNGPTIQCPANIVTAAPSGQTSTIVNYPPPVVTDNLPGATASCAPPSGSSFPVGITTVTCTATDTSGNRATCGFTITVNGGTPTARVTIDGGKDAVEFGTQTPVTPRRKPPKTESPCSFFTIENTGAAPLVLTYVSAVRTGNAVTSGKITDANERGTYTLSTVTSQQVETEVPAGTVITIGVRQTVRFCLRFDPLIPGVQTNTNNLTAPAVIPDLITSRCNFTLQGGAALSVNVVGNVAETLMLINPDNPRKASVVTFARSGNEFILTYSIFDPDLDTNRARYELLNSSGQIVGQAFEVDLAQAISQTGLLSGQSFTVEQRFTGANSHPEITGCRLTVTDGEGSVSKTATSSSSSASLRRRSRLTLAPPVIRIGR